MARKKADPNNMSFLDHVEELRWCLIRSIAGILVGAVIAGFFKEFIFDTVIFGPKKADFLTYEFFCKMGRFMGIESDFCDPNFTFKIQSKGMSDEFSAHIWTSILVGFVVAFPWVLYQVWRFIAPGLKSSEKKYSSGFIIICSLLFFIGVLFGYYMIAPLSVHFMITYGLSDQIVPEPSLESYIAYIRASILASGLLFELPVIIYFLTKIGLATPEGLRKNRKFALVIVLIVAAVITPPDVASQIIVAIPVLILYEVSIFISKFVLYRQKRREKKLATP
ncbi:sec-independent protein translocase protein TatC [Nonlabens dokdonensis]|jgi:sec-independent protein translocase protein TatC|uniref:Sec-independent protein translocase protein TatC n=2 Tax=Nonlabens dokdonensis TaxID=328515 RepID=L7WBZ5_NONDD|nr:twin-arginine translocase subunit TatC [Nonlabens dokdonensis]AGC77431.1 putative sec-independent protein translocase TatC [Nonlabens dokdonensis DSW-6]PZX40957.1 sec-independent protein translocase protein TatC [Nonlabens dokdonensis]